MKSHISSTCARLSLALLPLLLTSCNADLPAYSTRQMEDYESGKWGFYPSQRFISSNLEAPRVLKKQWDKQCDSDTEYYFISPRGPVVKPERAGPVIIDTDGNMVWRHSAFPRTYNFQVQEYKGAQYLTFWSGNDAVKGHGNGFYYMLDQEYRLVRTVGAVNGLHGDLHEFTITADGTGICTVFAPTEADLGEIQVPKDKNGKNWIWDPSFQEIDLETNELLFEWRGSRHLKIADSFKRPQGTQATSETAPWDFFHINSVDKDHLGNYLVSGRYYGLLYISGKSGEILWYLGGINNNFTDLSYGMATNMRWQHHARWADDRTAITLFDNNAQWGGGQSNKPSRGMKIRVDEKEMTAKIIFDITHPDGLVADAQGSLQVMPNGHLLAGYGSVAAFTEFSSTGEVLCDIRYAALYAGKNLGWTGGAVMSYRAFRMPWSGTPHYNPWVAFNRKQGLMYVSWNGATEVKRWMVEGTPSTSSIKDDWKFIVATDKHGFETELQVPSTRWNLLRLTAVDKESNAIRCWVVFPGPLLKQVECPTNDLIRANLRSTHLYLIAAILLVPILFLIWRCWSRISTVALPDREKLSSVKGEVSSFVGRIKNTGKRFSTKDDDDDGFLMHDQDEEISDDETTKIDTLEPTGYKSG